MLDLHNARPFTRRAFLAHGLTLASAAATVPSFLGRAALALAQAEKGAPAGSGSGGERILLVVQLAGGNDGLNTVIPFGDPAYYRARPSIGIPEREALRLGSKGASDGLGLHPRMGALKEMYDEGLVSIVPGVGYPNPNRSHFKSMDIWHTADTSATSDGWIGRYFDNQCAGAPGAEQTGDACSGHAGVAIGSEAPLAMQGRRFRPIALENPRMFRWTGEGADAETDAAYRALTGGGAEAGVGGAGEGEDVDFVLRTALDARIASEKIRAALSQGPLVNYPPSPLARQLAMVSALIRAGLETRVFYVSLSGFDTHAGQGGVAGQHANLLEQYSRALQAFYRELHAQGEDRRVLTLTFSEFGRRVAQNGSGGTDHGAAAPIFLAGPMVKPGVLGKTPSLTDLDGGDLRFTLDFRSLYAGILADWMEADPAPILGRNWRPAKLFRS